MAQRKPIADQMTICASFYYSANKSTHPLLILLLPLTFDVELLLIPSELRRAFPLELVPGDRELVVDGNLVIHERPHGGEGQISVLQLHVLKLLVLLVRPAQRPDELVAIVSPAIWRNKLTRSGTWSSR